MIAARYGCKSLLQLPLTRWPVTTKLIQARAVSSVANWGYSPTNEGNLAPWLDVRGIQLGNVQVEFTEDGESRLITTSQIFEGEALITIPKQEIFCGLNVFSKSTAAAKLIGDALEGYAELDKPGTVQGKFFSVFKLSLLAWMQIHAQLLGPMERIRDPDHHEDVSWRSWIEFWPSHVINGVFLGDSDVQELLPVGPNYTTEQQKQFTLQLGQQERFFNVLCGALEYDLQHLLDIVEARSVTKDDLFAESMQKLYSVVMSKGTDFGSIDNDELRNLGFGIIPIVDFVRHGETQANSALKANSVLKFDQSDVSDFKLIAMEPLQPGAEVRRDLGVRCNESAVCDLGLILGGLPAGPEASYPRRHEIL